MLGFASSLKDIDRKVAKLSSTIEIVAKAENDTNYRARVALATSAVLKCRVCLSTPHNDDIGFMACCSTLTGCYGCLERACSTIAANCINCLTPRAATHLHRVAGMRDLLQAIHVPSDSDTDDNIPLFQD